MNMENVCLLNLAHSPSIEKVMYNLNPAVIKSILSSMPQQEFILHARFIRRKAFNSEPGSIRRVMFFNLYRWCRVKYRERFQ
jgi:hypothetical protein